MATKPKKVGTRKGTDGSQQYTSSRAARDPEFREKILRTARNTKQKVDPKAVGKASHQSFMQYGVNDLAKKSLATYRARKAVGKPKGGR